MFRESKEITDVKTEVARFIYSLSIVRTVVSSQFFVFINCLLEKFVK